MKNVDSLLWMCSALRFLVSRMRALGILHEVKSKGMDLVFCNVQWWNRLQCIFGQDALVIGEGQNSTRNCNPREDLYKFHTMCICTIHPRNADHHRDVDHPGASCIGTEHEVTESPEWTILSHPKVPLYQQESYSGLVC